MTVNIGMATPADSRPGNDLQSAKYVEELSCLFCGRPIEIRLLENDCWVLGHIPMRCGPLISGNDLKEVLEEYSRLKALMPALRIGMAYKLLEIKDDRPD